MSHALVLTQQAPIVATRRLVQLSVASPRRASAMLMQLWSEKTFVFAQAYAGSLAALGLAQLSLMRMATASTMSGGTMHASQATSSRLLRSGSEIARATLAPLAKRVRRNFK